MICYSSCSPRETLFYFKKNFIQSLNNLFKVGWMLKNPDADADFFVKRKGQKIRKNWWK